MASGQGGPPAAVMQQFQLLQAKAQRKFNELRDLPTTWPGAEHRYHKAFSCFSTLWRFQQEHR